MLAHRDYIGEVNVYLVAVFRLSFHYGSAVGFGARVISNTENRQNCGIIGDMRKLTKLTKLIVVITLAIVGVIVSSFSSSAAAFDLKRDTCSSSKAALDSARIELKWRVGKVSDGDTITVLDAGNNQHKISLNGIHAPKKTQAFCEKSRVHLASLWCGMGS